MRRLHADQADIDGALVRRLLHEQFPHWVDRPLRPVESAGTDNELFRLGDDLVVRLPLVERAAAQVDKEWRWLRWLGPQLPLSVPEPVALGAPSQGYEWSWAVHRWLDGADATRASLVDLQQAAADLASFVVALRRVDTRDGPPPGRHNFGRGGPLAVRDDAVRTALAAIDDEVDASAALRVWEDALRAPPFDGSPTWVHGDLFPGNLLVRDGRLHAVIDWGGLAVGDPSVELLAAWACLDAESRGTFRDALDVDDAMWERGRGWAVSVAVIALPYYRATNPGLAAVARQVLGEVLAD